jgi:hypothetical protein
MNLFSPIGNKPIPTHLDLYNRLNVDIRNNNFHGVNEFEESRNNNNFH